MQIVEYTNTVTDHLGMNGPVDNVKVVHNTVLVISEKEGKELLEQWNQNARNNARNFNRTNPYRYDFVSSRPATQEEIETMDLYSPVS